MSQHKIAYSGIEGSFAGIASRKLFPEGDLIPCKSFKEAYNAVEEGRCDFAVLPVENSFAGEVGQVTDLMFEGDLKVDGVYLLRVTQNLLGVPGSTIDDIKRVISHPQALEQCAEYLEEHGIGTEQSENTARAAREVAKMADKTVGAVASIETAELYNLIVLEENINKDSMNTTRFAVVSKNEKHIKSGNYTHILMFTVKHQAGALAKSIGVIGKYGYNMRVIRSRPLKNLQWQYYFYIEIEGILDSKEGEAMLNELGMQCETLKVLGSYSIGGEHI